MGDLDTFANISAATLIGYVVRLRHEEERRGICAGESSIWEMMYESGWTSSPEPPADLRPRPENPEPRIVKVPKGFMLRELNGAERPPARKPAQSKR